MTDILSKVESIFADHLDLNDQKVTEEVSIIDDLGADSIDIVEMVVTLEEAFGIRISSEEAEKMVTVGDVTRYIAGKCPALA